MMFRLVAEQGLANMKFYSSDGRNPLLPKLVVTYTSSGTDCVTLQPGVEGRDAMVWSNNRTTNNGATDDFIAATWTWGGTPGSHKILLTFPTVFIACAASLRRMRPDV